MITSQEMSRRSGAAGRKAFTLVELLVVIGIIAVLISILLPSLAKARSAALKVACASNMRQIGQMFQMYESSNRGKWPLARNAAGNWGDYNTYVCGAIWPHAISPKGEPATPVSAWMPADYDNYVASPKAFVCPAQPQDADVQRTYILMGRPHWIGGSANASTANMVYGNLPRPGLICAPSRMPSKFRSSETILMGEMQASGPAHDWVTGAQDKYHMGGNLATADFGEFVQDLRGPWAHDQQGANLLFVDGHVAYQKALRPYGSAAWQLDGWGGDQDTRRWVSQFVVDKDAKWDWAPSDWVRCAWDAPLANP